LNTISPERSPRLLQRQLSRLLMIDLQERLLPVIPDAPVLLANCRTLLEGARTLGIPADATEQYPQGLGTTDPSILELVEHVGEKLRFSAFGALEWMTDSQAGLATPQVVLAGIETHVCVLQTGLDLLAAGFDVFVVVDAVCSRRARDAEFALQRLRDSGAVLTSVESVLFEWCETARAAEFKTISRLVKERG
jgi:nicotinamidase-related amidase